MFSTKPFSLLTFGAKKGTENPDALNYTLIIKVYQPEISCKSQFWIALNYIAVTFTNFTELCTLLALERAS